MSEESTTTCTTASSTKKFRTRSSMRSKLSKIVLEGRMFSDSSTVLGPIRPGILDGALPDFATLRSRLRKLESMEDEGA